MRGVEIFGTRISAFRARVYVSLQSHTSLSLSPCTMSGTSSSSPVLGLSNRRNATGSSSSNEGRRLKTSMRARRIITTMDRGLHGARAESKRKRGSSDEECESRVDDGQAMVSPDGDDETDGGHAGLTIGVTASKPTSLSTTDRSISPEKPTPLRKRKQLYLSSKAVEDSTSAAEARESSGTSRIPQVPLFSTASKRQLQSLTSKDSLKHTSNPITHSTVGATSMHYVTSSTGHQVQNRITAGGPSSDHGWWATRMAKLKKQLVAESQQSDIFHGISIYINGYVGTEIGNKELMRLLALNGAAIHYLPNGSTTHIISAMPLSAKKRQEMLDKKMGRVKKFVKVEWALDSLEVGKRRPEHLYAHPIETQRGIADMFLPVAAKPSSFATTAKTTTTPTIPDWREAARAAAATITKPKGCS